VGDYIGARKGYLECAFFIYKKIGIKKEILLALIICAIGFSIGTISHDPYFIVFSFGLLVGIGCGILTVCSLWPSWPHFGNTNAMITGIIIVGYSISPGLLGMVFTYIVNPNNLTPDGSKSIDIKYPEIVSSRVPYSLIVFSVLTLILGIFAILMIYDKPHTKSSESIHDEVQTEMSYKEILTCSKFWRLFCIAYFEYFALNFLVCDYKIILLEYIKDDHLATYSYIFATVSIIVGRIMWMIILEKSSFNSMFTLINIITIVLSITMPMIWNNSLLLICWICMFYFTSGGIYPSLLIETFTMFPGEDGKKVFPIITISWTLCTFSIALITEIGDNWGYELACYIIALATFVGQLIISFWPREEKVVVKYINLEENEELQMSLINSSDRVKS
jgi:fucose permease